VRASFLYKLNVLLSTRNREREKRDSEIAEGCLGIRPCWSFYYGQVVLFLYVLRVQSDVTEFRVALLVAVK